MLDALVWSGPFASSAVNPDDITTKQFEYSEEGRKEAIEWIQKMYDERKMNGTMPHPSIRQKIYKTGKYRKSGKLIRIILWSGCIYEQNYIYNTCNYKLH